MVDTYFEVSALAEQLANKLNNGTDGTDGDNIAEYGLNNIFPSETYRFYICGDTGSFKQPERTGNTVINYINGEYRVISNDVEGVDKDTSNAVVQMRVEFLIPLRGGDERNKDLLEAVRDLTNNELKYTEETESNGTSMLYTHFTNYSILNTGTRAQRDIVGDSLNLTIFVTHTFVALGVASSAISLEVAHPKRTNDDGSTYFEKVAASKFGIARKTESDSNVYTDSEKDYPETKQQPTSSVLTITADLLTRLLALDYYIARYTYDGIVEPFVIRVTRPGMTYDNSGNLSIADKTTEYTVIINAAGINGELGTISSTSVTFTTAAPNLTESEVETT